MIGRRLLGLAVLPLLALAGCEPGVKLTEQTGYRGTGLVQISDPDNQLPPGDLPPPPFPLPPGGGGDRVQGQNIRLLGHLSNDEFTHFMSSMAQWVSGDATNCGFCHNLNDMSDDSPYRMQVARRMIQMTWALNDQWSGHTGQTGVSCYTCHRGNEVPQYVWSAEPPQDKLAVWGQRRGQNAPSPNVGYASLPFNVFGEYFGGNPEVVRISSDSAYPGRNRETTRAAEDSYAIMMHLSSALGVNCVHCHNSQSFRAWSLSRAQRATAWYGIRMVRDVNVAYLEPLARAGILPANRMGPTGDALNVNCLTCHQGQVKPLGGASFIPAHPYLRRGDVQPQPTEVRDPVERALDQPGDLTDVGTPEGERPQNQAPVR